MSGINDELDSIREEFKEAVSLPGEDVLEDDTTTPESVVILSPDPLESTEYFGYNYFKRDITFFDNIPTPSDFKLGPGDEIILSFWGEKNSREDFVINKEGLIYYENVGFINLSNKTITEAESVLSKELSRVYSTLDDKDGSTKLKLELGELKSINVYFSGQIENPGVNLVHPFSDVFSAMIQAGGVKQNGSLREVQLIRGKTIIATIDFYSFFTDGKNDFSSVRILDGDVIHVPMINNRVDIFGEVYNKGFFELFPNESLADLITYAGGLTPLASSKIVLDIVIPIEDRNFDENSFTSAIVDIKDTPKINLNNGDSVTVNKVIAVDTKVRVFGKVKRPGLYPLTESLKEVIDIAGGFNDPIFRQALYDEILILRKDKNQFYSIEHRVQYKDSNNFKLNVGDAIFVYENINYENLFSITVSGAVKKRGRFQFKSGMTVQDAIDLAEGFSLIANEEGITVTEVFTSIDDLGNEIDETIQVNNATLDFELTDGSVVNVLPMENVVSVEGNVYNPGLVTHTGRRSIQKYINLAGGLKPNSLKNNIYVQRTNGRVKTVSLFNGWTTFVKPGDTIVVPFDDSAQDFDPTTFTSNILSILTNLVAIIAIVDNND